MPKTAKEWISDLYGRLYEFFLRIFFVNWNVTAQNGALFPQNLHYSHAKTCIYWYSGYSPNDVLFAPKTYIIPAQKLVLLSWTLVFTGVQTIPKCTIIFSKGVLSPQMVCYYRAKTCITRPNPCIYWCSDYPPKWCIIPQKTCIMTAQKGVLLLTNGR